MQTDWSVEQWGQLACPAVSLPCALLVNKLVFKVWSRSLTLAIQLAFGRIVFSMTDNEISIQ